MNTENGAATPPIETATPPEDDGKPKPIFVVFITKDGAIEVTSPCLHDIVLCCGLLERAKDRVKELHDQAAQSRIVKVNGPVGRLIDQIRGNRPK